MQITVLCLACGSVSSRASERRKLSSQASHHVVPLLTLGEGYGSCRVCLFLCVCVSGKSHLTSEASVRRENAATYSAGNEGQNVCGVFSEKVQLQRSSVPSLDGHTSGQPFFLQKTRMRIVDTRVLDKTVHDVKLPT